MNIRILSSKDKGNPSSALWRKNNFSGNSKCPNLKVWQEASPGKERKKKKSGSEHMWESFLSVIFTKMLAKERKILK